MPSPRALLACLLLGLAVLRGAQPDEDPFRFVAVPACKTSIYVGTVTMIPGRFERRADHYVASYEAKVFPFFFYSEKGTLRIDMDQAALERLQRGENVAFKGEALNSSGEKRKLEGSAQPENGRSGRLKIKIFVSSSIKLSFPARYSFESGPKS